MGVDPYELNPADDPDARGQSINLRSHEAARAAAANFPAAAIWRLWSTQAAALVPDGSLAAVFIDGDHAYSKVLQDLRVWERKVRRGGLVIGHDFSPPWMVEVARAVARHRGNRSITLGVDATFWWRVP